MLALFAPGPRSLVLGEKTWQARPLRIGDIFQLGLIAAETVSDPLANLDVNNPAALRDAYDAAEKWPPDWWDGYISAAGHLYVLTAVLRDHLLSPSEAADLLSIITESEWRVLVRVAFGGDPALTVHRIIDDRIGVEPVEQPGKSWPEVVATVCQAYGYRPCDVMEMTFPEFIMLQSGGERKLVPKATREGMAARRAFWQSESSPEPFTQPAECSPDLSGPTAP